MRDRARPQLAAGSEHRAGHDLALAGAEGGGGGGHRLRGPVLARAGNQFPGGRSEGSRPPVAWCLAIALVALPIVGVLRGWFAAGRWPVTQLTVQAEFKHVSADEIRAAVRPRLGKGFFALDLDAVQKAVAALPWVESAEARKRWPDTLAVAHLRAPAVRALERQAADQSAGLVFDAPRCAATSATLPEPAWTGCAAGRSGELLRRNAQGRSPARSCRSPG